MAKQYETVIGLEVHVELATATKIFCGCSTKFGAAPNTHTCPVCTGMPGSLPVLNKKVVEYALALGMAANCEINRYCRFDRKNYFYPDNPQNYQISQLYLPICHDGHLEITTENGKKTIRIHEMHMEEDAGKLIHDEWEDCSLVDYNRSGVPLIEIVSEPDMRTAQEVIAYLEKLRMICQYLGISDCKLQEGSMRADVNLSVREVGSDRMGTRTEMKNLNSFKAITHAIEGERERQIELLEEGKEVIQETRRWDDNKESSHAMRSKEDAKDYRYFPDPDLQPMQIPTEWMEQIRSRQPEFQEERAATGTPVENRLSELWSIFDYLMPGFLYSYSHFREELEVQIVQHESEEASERLRKMIRPFVLRRLKKDVLRDLPDKLEENMYTRLEGEQQKLYDAHVKRMKLLLDKQSEEEFNTSKIVILSELTKLRQICCDPALLFEEYKGESAKLEMCVDLIRNAVENGHKILVFSQFTTMLSRLADRLENEETAYYMLTGSTGKEKRAKLVEEFNKEDNPTAVFLISLKAGGTGLNLTTADIVIHYDPWWNLAVQNQATDRAHRIGQKNVVNVYKLIAKDTIEENIVKLQEKKHALADQILSGEDMGSGSFSREEILELLGGK